MRVYPYEGWGDGDAMIDRLEADLGLSFAQRPEATRRVHSSLGPSRLGALRFANSFTRQAVVNKDCIVNLTSGRQIRNVTKMALRSVRSFGRESHKPSGSQWGGEGE